MRKTETAHALWMHREETRVRKRIYKEIDFCLPGKPSILHIINDKELHHFVHISQEKDDMVAYTPDNTYGIQNRKVRVKFGRYLSKFYSDILSPDTIRDYAAGYRTSRANNGVMFALSEDDIEWVYENGPSSCMRGKDWAHSCGQHPCRLYGMNKDVAVAYIYRSGRITARAVVNTNTKKWTKIYGDLTLLSNKLSLLKYEEGTLQGVTFPVVSIPSKDHRFFLMPYIDNSNQRFDIEDDVITISSSGKILCKSTIGLGVLDVPVICYNCEEESPSENASEDYEGHTICGGCIDNHYRHCIINIERDVGWVNEEDTVYVENTEVHYLDSQDVLSYFSVEWSSIEDLYLYTLDIDVINTGNGYMYKAGAVRIRDGNGNYSYYSQEVFNPSDLFIDRTTWALYKEMPNGTDVTNIIPVDEHLDKKLEILHEQLSDIQSASGRHLKTHKAITLLRNAYEWEENSYLLNHAAENLVTLASNAEDTIRTA